MLRIGTSGWQYRHWKGRFYPPDVPSRRWLEHYADRFATVEVNNTFYRVPPRDTFVKWAARLPDDFVVTVKASRYLTHIRRLLDPKEPVTRLLDCAEGLGARLGPVLVQLPPGLTAEPDRLDETLHYFAGRARVAVEPRHPSWWIDDVRRVLEKHNAALCLADRGSRLVTPDWATSDWGYVRFHAGRAQPPSCYGRAALARWVERIGKLWPRDSETFVYFNNDGHGCAVRDAVVLARLATDLGFDTTRVPELSEAPVG
jgi:uncharacterized protein YecE (DUF72 family)